VRNRQKPRPHPNHDRWLVSYADFITLLFAFFVVLYSVAQVDRKKIAELAEAIQAAFEHGETPTRSSLPIMVQVRVVDTAKPVGLPYFPPGPPDGEDMTSLRKDLEQALAQEISRGEVALRSSPQGLVISLREIGFFESGSSGIKENSQSAFGRIAVLLGQRRCNVRIEGHTDNVPIHNSTFNSNWELSTARSTEVVRRLITQYQYAPDLLSAAGYAEYHPIASNDTAEGRALNRRVDVVILGRQQPSATSIHSSSPAQ
jgi:chemotaxis protein MotB